MATRPGDACVGRRAFVAAAAVAVVVGLVSRQVAWVPSWVGDALWATTAYFVVSAVATRARWWLRGVVALAFSFVVEISQLYHQPWIDQIRHTTLGHLALGTTFTWTDLVAYTAGVALGIAVTPQHGCLACRAHARWCWALVLVVALPAGAAGCSRWSGLDSDRQAGQGRCSVGYGCGPMVTTVMVTGVGPYSHHGRQARGVAFSTSDSHLSAGAGEGLVLVGVQPGMAGADVTK